MTDLEEVPTPDAPSPGAVFDALPEDVQVAAGTFAIVLSKVAMNMATKVEADFAGDHLAALYLAQVKRADEAEAKLAARAADTERLDEAQRRFVALDFDYAMYPDEKTEQTITAAIIELPRGQRYGCDLRAALDAAILRFAEEGR